MAIRVATSTASATVGVSGRMTFCLTRLSRDRRSAGESRQIKRILRVTEQKPT